MALASDEAAGETGGDDGSSPDANVLDFAWILFFLRNKQRRKKKKKTKKTLFMLKRKGWLVKVVVSGEANHLMRMNQPCVFVCV